MADYDIYNKELWRLGYGYALWFPNPPMDSTSATLYDRVHIGDVGFLDGGSWTRLFNATLPVDAPANSAMGVPEGYKPFAVSASHILVEENVFTVPSSLQSTSVRQTALQMSGNGGASAPLAVGFSFSCEATHGAVCLTRSCTTREQLRKGVDPKAWLREHYDALYAFANDKHRYGLEAGQIMFITETHRVSSWALAVLRGGNQESSISISAGTEALGGGEMRLSWRWERCTSAIHKSSSEKNADDNQTIFLKGLKASKRRQFIPRALRAAAEPPPDDYDYSHENGEAVFAGSISGSSEDTSSSASANLQTRPCFHPSDAILEYILEHSEQPLAIIHDDDLVDSQKISVDGQYLSSSQIHSIIADYERRYFPEIRHPENEQGTGPSTTASSSNSQEQNAAAQTGLSLLQYLGSAASPPLSPPKAISRCEELDTEPDVGQRSFALWPSAFDGPSKHADVNDDKTMSSFTPRGTTNGSTAPDILSWTNQDPRESTMFNSWGTLYRFTTNVAPNGMSVTTLWRSIRSNREERVAKLEWASNGGLGRAVIGKTTFPMSDLVRHDPRSYNTRMFNGPDGLQYRWRASNISQDITLQDDTGSVVAFFRPVRTIRTQSGDVHGEMHFLRSAGAGNAMKPPMMDTIVVTAMLFRFCQSFGL